VLLLAVALVGAACGEETGQPLPGPAPPLGPSGSVRIAVETRVANLDPLRAGTRSERIVSRQIYEPLVGRIRPPFGAGRPRASLARSLRPSAGGTIWTARLRGGVRFHDGSLLDAGAVLDNVERWLADPGAGRPLRDLAAADSPRPGIVRFQLERPLEELPRLLSRGRYGIAAPAALPGRSGAPLRGEPVGTGPFELRERDRSGVLLARNSEWWGSRLELGPGVDSVALVVTAGRRDRLDALDRGAVAVADDVRPQPLARRARRSGLLSWISGRGVTIGFDRSVRGIQTTRPDVSLSSLWLTELR
jgi:peptide/nickel transport system substrate-binding protein